MSGYVWKVGVVADTHDIRNVMPLWRFYLAIAVGTVGAMVAGYGVNSESWWAVVVGALLLGCCALIAMPVIKMNVGRYGWAAFFPPARKSR
jgi:hypothetical protein